MVKYWFASFPLSWRDPVSNLLSSNIYDQSMLSHNHLTRSQSWAVVSLLCFNWQYTLAERQIKWTPFKMVRTKVGHVRFYLPSLAKNKCRYDWRITIYHFSLFMRIMFYTTLYVYIYPGYYNLYRATECMIKQQVSDAVILYVLYLCMYMPFFKLTFSS